MLVLAISARPKNIRATATVLESSPAFNCGPVETIVEILMIKIVANNSDKDKFFTNPTSFTYIIH